MAARASKNNVLAGIFLIASLGLFVATVIVLSAVGDSFQPKSKYIVDSANTTSPTRIRTTTRAIVPDLDDASTC